ncbi:unannotated protein [freshwater metagenome]|uniref:Unannotated protein n=1 Tax=freshwater metagenome TaxID=449393 RepID=A0A6J6F3H4_9ZZZZ
MHPGHSEVQRARVRERSAGHQGGHDRCAHLVGESRQLFVGARANHTATNIENRFGRFSNHLSSDLHLLLVGLGNRVIAGQINLRRPNKGGALLLSVFRDVHKHWARPARGSNVNSSSDDGRNLFGLRHQERVLRDRHRHTGDVDFLERVSPHRSRENLASDGEQRDRVHVCISDRGHEVCCART